MYIYTQNRCSEIGQLLKDILYYDNGLYMHCLRVCKYAILIGVNVGLGKDDLKQLWQAALLHDYGKTMVDIKILNKPGVLTSVERSIVEKHVVFGVDYLQRNTNLETKAITAILEHHERLDGTGYPFNETSISVLGRILSIADVYDALTSIRSYKCAFSHEQAIRMIKEENGFDKEILQSFEETYNEVLFCAIRHTVGFDSIYFIYRSICVGIEQSAG